MADVQATVLDRLEAMYGTPKRDNLEAFYDLYEQALQGWSDEILTAATSRVIAEFSNTYGWPTPGIVNKACRDVAPRFVKPHRPRQPDRNIPPPTPEEQARIDEAIARMKQDIASKAMPGSPEAKPIPLADRVALKRMQRKSTGMLHRTTSALSQVSKRMTGEHSE